MYIEISSTIYLWKYDVTYRKCLIRLGYMNNILTNFTNKVFSYRWFAVKCNFDCTGKLEFIIVLQEKSFTKAALFLFLRGAAGTIPTNGMNEVTPFFRFCFMNHPFSKLYFHQHVKQVFSRDNRTRLAIKI